MYLEKHNQDDIHQFGKPLKFYYYYMNMIRNQFIIKLKRLIHHFMSN